MIGSLCPCSLPRRPCRWIQAHPAHRPRIRLLRPPVGPAAASPRWPAPSKTSGLMRRRYGYYWTKLIAAVVLLAAWVLAFIWIGDSWWQLVSAARARGRDDPDRVSGSRCGAPSNVQVRRLERMGQPHPGQPVRRDQLRLVAEQAQPPSRQPQQGRRRPRHRPPGDRLHPGAGHPAPQPADALAGRPPGLVLLPDPSPRGPLAARRRYPPRPRPPARSSVAGWN